MERLEDETADGFIVRFFKNLISDQETRNELFSLVSSAESLEDWTYVSALGVVLAKTDPELSDRRQDENASDFVRRTVKALIAKGNPGTAQSIEELLGDMSSYLGDENVPDAFRLALSSLARRTVR